METKEMKLSYNKLWKTLIGVCYSTLAKLKRGENVNTDVLLKICTALECNISDIVEVVE